MDATLEQKSAPARVRALRVNESKLASLAANAVALAKGHTKAIEAAAKKFTPQQQQTPQPPNEQIQKESKCRQNGFVLHLSILC